METQYWKFKSFDNPDDDIEAQYQVKKIYWKVKLFDKPDNDGVDVLVPAFHPWQAPHPDIKDKKRYDKKDKIR